MSSARSPSGDVAPVDARLEIRRIALSAAGSNALLPRGAHAGQRRNAARIDPQRDVARFGDVRRVTQQTESRDVGRAPGADGDGGAAGRAR